MLDPKYVRQSFKDIAEQLQKRGFIMDQEKFNKLEGERKQLQMNMQDLQNARNIRSKEIGIAKAKGQETESAYQELKELSDELKATEVKFTQTQIELDDFLLRLPNLTHESVPFGKSEEDNQLIRTWGEPKKFNFTPKDHVELGSADHGIDFSTAAKIAGARFVVLRGHIARLQRALIQFMMDLHVNEHGYQEIYVPYLVNGQSLVGTGQFPNLKEDVFGLQGQWDYYLIPTSEVSVTNTVRDEILDSKKLPLKYVCYSTCFRSEAGS